MKILKDKTIGKQFLLGGCIKVFIVLLLMCGICVIITTADSTDTATSVETSTDDINESEHESTYIELESEEEEVETLVDADETFIDLIDESADKLPVVDTGLIHVKSLHVRRTGDSSSADNIIGTVVYGDSVNIIDTINGWHKIEYGEGYGYVYSKYVDIDGYKNEGDDNDTIEVITPDKNIIPTPDVIMPNKEGFESTTNDVNIQATDVIGYDYIDPDILYDVVADIAPELISICDALIYNYEQYGLKPSFQLAVFCLESGYGTSYLARNKNNICGLNAYATSSKSVYENATYFETKSDCVLKFGSIIYNNYVLCGRTSIERISTKYCPPNSQNWTNLVSSIQKNIERTYNSYSV